MSYKYILLIKQQFELDKKDMKHTDYNDDVPTDYNARWADDF